MDGNVTREQLVTILYQYAQLMKHDTSKTTELVNYADAGLVADYATEAMEWAIANGIVRGTSTTTISPQGNATRAQTATMLMHFIKLYEK